ncbi:MAG: pirin family protein, partial [Bacteroidia bacterium]
THALTYTLRDANHGVYVFMISGQAKANGIALQQRDALGIYESPEIFVEADKGAEILLIEVPMH